MKAFIAACTVTLVLIATVITCSVFVDRSIDEIYNALALLNVENNDRLAEDVRIIYIAFEKKERILGFTVSHGELTELGKDFSELLGAAMAEDEGAVTITKSRLEKSLLRLKRLYGLNLESVF